MNYNCNITRLTFVFFVTITLSYITNAQQQNHSFEDGVIYLSKLIAQQDFKNINDDTQKVDSLYKVSVNYYNGDISEALLALTFATLPFNRMPVSIPLINIRIQLRLPSVNKELFKKKRDNLPGIVFFDSNNFAGKDKDKVAHFFGNAFLAYNISIFNVSKFLGMIVEMFESTFKVSGGIDYRDIQTNYLGEYFGRSLNKNSKLMPSDFFKVYSLFYFSYN